MEHQAQICQESGRKDHMTTLEPISWLVFYIVIGSLLERQIIVCMCWQTQSLTCEYAKVLTEK